MPAQKQVGELYQQPKPADGCERCHNRKKVHAEPAAEMLLVRSHAEAPQPTPHSISNWNGKQGSPAPVAVPAAILATLASGDWSLRCLPLGGAAASSGRQRPLVERYA